jgi:hypothetical protein
MESFPTTCFPKRGYFDGHCQDAHSTAEHCAIEVIFSEVFVEIQNRTCTVSKATPYISLPGFQQFSYRRLLHAEVGGCPIGCYPLEKFIREDIPWVRYMLMKVAVV